MPLIDMAGGEHHIAFRNFSGPLKIINCPSALSTMCVDISSGATITIDSSCTAGIIFVRGIGNIANNGTMTVNTVAQLDQSSISSATWDKALADHVAAGTFGEFTQKKLLTKTQFIGL